jgi:molybdate transport system permease protein
MEYSDAHHLAAVMLGFSFIVLMALNLYNQRQRNRLTGAA